MNEKIRMGIIGGSGLEEIFKGKKKKMKTPYGDVIVNILMLEGKKVAFISRHGEKHQYAPHKVNYRGNIWALKELGVEKIIASNAVGGIKEGIKPGDLVIPHDFIDFTKNRPLTFFDQEKVHHIDMTNPYCPELRQIIIEKSSKYKINTWEKGVYVCTEGPRFETPAEIRMFRLIGADIVGMTTVPETVLAREQKICYATICTVTNYAAGMQEKISSDEVMRIMKKVVPIVIGIIKDTIGSIS